MSTFFKHSSWMMFVILLAACAPVVGQLVEPGQNPVETPATTPTTASAPTAILLPTETLSPTPAITVTSTPYPKFPLDGYVMVFRKDGDLYFQDGNNAPLKLTHIGEKEPSPILSDDNKKVVFTHADNINSINTDGSQERVIITIDWLTAIGVGTKAVNLTFIPDTHQMLFNTHRCESQVQDAPCSIGLFRADTDTGNLKEILLPGEIGRLDSTRNFKVSPNGKMIAVGMAGHLIILDINGKVIRQNVLPYEPSDARTVPFPSLFWLPDSSGLIVALPNTFYDSHAYHIAGHTIWHYTIDSNVAIQIPFDPPPMLNTFQVSPDGNWIVYGGLGYDPSVYLGNLADGHTQIFGDAYQVYFSWSPDSKHFIGTSASSILGAIDTPTLTPTCHFAKWVDAGHFTCWSDERIRMAEINDGVVKIYDLGFDKDVYHSVFIKPK